MQIFLARRVMAALVLTTTILLSTSLASAQRTGAGRGEACGSILGITCQRGLWCQIPASPFTCLMADGLGSCDVIPQACPRIFNPVCGCDGRTYSNDCTRRMAQVQLAHPGRC